MYVPEHFPRYRPTTALAASTDPATPTAAHPPLTLEWLVARDIDAYSARRRARGADPARDAATGLRAAATMEPQASTRPSPVSLRKNGTRVVGQA